MNLLLAPIAPLAFWILIVAGWLLGELDLKRTALFVLLWLVGFAARGGPYGMLFVPYVAVLDIALVLAIFKGDIQLH